MIAIGQTVGNYLLTGVLGEGGAATVYLAEHLRLKSHHALKVLHFQAPLAVTRMMAEGRAQAGLNHPNIVQVTDVLEHQDCPILVMEFVDGPSLNRALSKMRFTAPEALGLFAGILAAVEHSHGHKIVHRDLKPGNVMLSCSGDTVIPKVTDFGMLKGLGGVSKALTLEGACFGTPQYMAPEQIRDASRVDERADIFALGVALYEMLAGRRPFDGDDMIAIFEKVDAGQFTPLNELEPELEPELVELVHQCMAVDAAERPASCAEIRQRLFRGEQPPSAPSVESIAHLRRQDAGIRGPNLDSRSQQPAPRRPIKNSPPPRVRSVASMPAPTEDTSWLAYWQEAAIGGALLLALFALALFLPTLMPPRADDPGPTAEEPADLTASAEMPPEPAPATAPEPPEPVAEQPIAPTARPVASPRPRPKPVPTPTPDPEPAPSTPEVEEPTDTEVGTEEPATAASARVRRVGEADRVVLVGADGSRFELEAQVPPGAYEILAWFPGQETPKSSGQLTVGSANIDVRCSAFMFLCGHE